MANLVVPKLEDLPVTPEDNVRFYAEKLLEKGIPWEHFVKAGWLTEAEYESIRRFEKKPSAEEGAAFAEIILDLLGKVIQEETVHFILTFVDKWFKEFPDLITCFLDLERTKAPYPFAPFMRLLKRSPDDWYYSAKATKILIQLLVTAKQTESKRHFVGDHSEYIKFISQWFRTQLKKKEDRDVTLALTNLKIFLTVNTFREEFADPDSISVLLSIIQGAEKKNFQVIYHTINSFWLLSFNKTFLSSVHDTKLILFLVDQMRGQTKEKVIRIALSTLRNLLNVANNNEQMLEAGILRPLQNHSSKNWGDEDIKEDLQGLSDALQQDILNLSSYDVYKREVLSGDLDWTPSHRSEKFWRENALHLEEEDNRVLIALRELIKSPDPKVVAVACFDIGEFARFHPRGKIILQKLDMKVPIMTLMESKDPEVKKNALLAVQKLMVHNWRSIITDSTTPKP